MINWIANRADGGLAVFRSYRATFRRAVLYICANRTGEGLSAGDFLVKLYRLVAGDSADPSWISIDIFLKICYDFPRVKSSLGLNLENKEQEISDLYQAVHECKECPLYRLAKNPVPGAGSANAQIMFIGEGPGEKEDELGLPFVGAAGKLLDEMLKSIDLKREDVYIANVVKHRPPGNRDPKPEEVAACWPYLQKQIDIIKPKLIVCLGRHSLGRFLPNVGPISAVHGRCFVRKNQAYMALYHPAVGLYNGGMRETLFKDFAKIKVALKKIDIDK